MTDKGSGVSDGPYHQMLGGIISAWALDIGAPGVRACVQALVGAGDDFWKRANLRSAKAIGGADPFPKMFSLLVCAWNDDSSPGAVRSVLRFLVDREDFWSALPHLSQGGLSGGVDALERGGFTELLGLLKQAQENR